MSKNFRESLKQILRFLLPSGIYPLVNGVFPLVNRDSNPTKLPQVFNIKELEAIKLNIKNFGYQQARLQAKDSSLIEPPKEPTFHGIASKPTTQSDIQSQWFLYWCKTLGVPPMPHRKLWEFAFCLQALFEHRVLKEGSKGIGFGCGEEPLPAYFASKGIEITATDLSPDRVVGLGWAETGQHAANKDKLFYQHLVDRTTFEKNVGITYVDMNSIPDELDNKFDFCWSICALEHLGSIKLGQRFIEESLRVLKPGGIAVHTTEFNYTSDDMTVDNWPTVLFRKRDFEEIFTRLSKAGNQPLNPCFEVGSGVLDGFIDLPPFSFEESWDKISKEPHLKLCIDGFPATCFGLVVKKADYENAGVIIPH